MKRDRGRLGYEAHWPVGTLAFGQWHRIVSALHRHGGLGPRWVLSGPQAFDHAGSVVALGAVTSLGLVWPSGL